MAVRMSREGKIILGVVLTGVGVGAGLYFWQKYQAGKGVTNAVGSPNLVINPALVSAAGGPQALTADVSWTNSSAGSVLYVVQAAVLEQWNGQTGVIGGHMWVNSSDLAQAEAAGASQAAADAQNPSLRLLTQSVAASGSGQLSFAGQIDPAAIVQPFAVVAWIAAGGSTSKLVVPDPVGTRVGLSASGAYTLIRPLGTD